MCGFDADRCEVYLLAHPKARKQHECLVCDTRIERGETYERHSWIHDGYPGRAKVCSWCAVALQVFQRHHGSSPSPDWFEQALRDCFDGADKGDPDARIWRDMTAGILRRSRKAKNR